tara:strand:- start:10044 stop:10583 length:540 start_codon:yes stop_codon:yes gene_type:complete
VINLIPFFIIILFSACTNDPNVVQEFVANKELPAEETENAEVLITTDGKLRVKIYSESIKRFENTEPELILNGNVKITFYDNSKAPTSMLNSNYVEVYEKENIMIARDDVVLISNESDKLETEKLVLNEQKEKVYTNEKVIITTKNEVIKGVGFESNLDFSDYKLSKITGVIDLSFNSD